jgi:hypothetical protein
MRDTKKMNSKTNRAVKRPVKGKEQSPYARAMARQRVKGKPPQRFQEGGVAESDDPASLAAALYQQRIARGDSPIDLPYTGSPGRPDIISQLRANPDDPDAARLLKLLNKPGTLQKGWRIG